MLFNIILYVIAGLLVIFGAMVMLRPANFTKKDSKDFEAAVKKTKRYGVIALGISLIIVIITLVLR